MSDKERVSSVIDFIGKHLDETLELEALCRITYFSNYRTKCAFESLFGMHWKQLNDEIVIHLLRLDPLVHFAQGMSGQLNERGHQSYQPIAGHGW